MRRAGVRQLRRDWVWGGPHGRGHSEGGLVSLCRRHRCVQRCVLSYSSGGQAMAAAVAGLKPGVGRGVFLLEAQGRAQLLPLSSSSRLHVTPPSSSSPSSVTLTHPSLSEGQLGDAGPTGQPRTTPAPRNPSLHHICTVPLSQVIG